METILEYSEDNSANTRILAWKSGLQIFIENPFGVGAGNFPSVFGRFYNQEFLETVDWGGGRWISPHSMYIQCLTELGFIGIGLLFYLFIINFKLLSNLSKKVLDRNLMNNIVFFKASITGFLVNAAFLGVVYYPHIFLISAVVVSFYNINILNTELNE